MSRQFQRYYILILLCCFSSAVLAKESHPLSDIANVAKTFMLSQYNDVEQDIRISVGSLDRRLRLSKCQNELEAYSPGYPKRGGNSMVGVRCNDSKPWSIYVPVSIKHFKSVAVLKQSVSRNETLNASNVIFRKMDINRMTAGYFENLDELQGRIVSRTLPAETVLTHQLVKHEQAIRRGQSVTLIARNAVIEVRAEGLAMSQGIIGERIKVKNLKTNRIIEGTVLNKELINVNL